MKKLSVLLLCFCLLFSLASCFSHEPTKGTPEDSATESGTGGSMGTESTERTESMEKTEDTKDPSQVQKPEGTIIPAYSYSDKYYRVDRYSSGKTHYQIYGLSGKVVFSEITDVSVHLYMESSYVVGITSYSDDFGSNIIKFYDFKNKRMSKSFSNVVVADEGVVAYRDETKGKRTLVAQDIFDETKLYKEFSLECDLYTTSQIKSIKLFNGRIFMTYFDASNALQQTHWSVFTFKETDYGFFSDYAAIVELYSQIHTATRRYGALLDYTELFGIIDAQQLEWADRLTDSVCSLFPSEQTKLACQYAVKDLNFDGIFELILLRNDCEVVAIFTKVDGKPVLLDHYWEGRQCLIDHRGRIYVVEGDWKNNLLWRVYQISEDGKSLKWLDAVGYENCEVINDVMAADYFKIENEQKISVSKSEYQAIAGRYLFPNRTMNESVAGIETFDAKGSLYQARRADARQAFLGVVENRIPVFNVETGEFCDLSACKTLTSGRPITEVQNLGYTLTDLNWDYVPELIIDCQDTVILRYHAGVVYFYPLSDQTMHRLDTNDSYEWIQSDNLLQSGELSYQPLTLPLNRTISREEAWELANAYWGNAHLKSDVVAGTRLTSRVLLFEDPDDSFCCYRVILVCEYSPADEDYGVGGNVEYVVFHQQPCVLIHVQTGTCQPDVYEQYPY
ncbi:MAG: hypothetical protein E7666_01880 [Ruminococcaceae bacterium]|nr:hypothetical protein [Oscillospiraceae bacterium]